MKLIIIGIFVALMTLGTSCAQISQPVAEVAPQATSDGIKVHGDWTVTVTNPDGTVDAVHEFENALDSDGEILLAALLSQETSIDSSYLRAISGSSDNPLSCEESFAHPGGFDPANWENIPAVTKRNGHTFMFSGTCTIDDETATQIARVVTAYVVSPSIMNNQDKFYLTSHDLSNPVSVELNQVVAFNVIVSFE